MNKIALSMLLVFGSQVYAGTAQEKTEALHQEAKGYKNRNITQATHPIFYQMVKDIAAKMNTDVPRYITLYSPEFEMVTNSGVICEGMLPMLAFATILGDLYVCHTALTDMSYEEVEGIVSVAMAEKAKSKMLKLVGVACGSFAATAASTAAYLRNSHVPEAGLVVFSSSLVTSILATIFAANSMRKTCDIKAVESTDPELVIKGIKGLSTLDDNYVGENFLSRIAGDRVKSFLRFVFYPVRPYTSKERIQYIKEFAAENSAA